MQDTAKIISGGQTGVDRAALDAAINNNIPHGGWCPKGRLADDGILPSIYLLKKIEIANYFILILNAGNPRDSSNP